MFLQSVKVDFYSRIVVEQGSVDAVDNKRGIFLLKAALPPAVAREGSWVTFLALYELLDEYPLHLIEVRQPAQLAENVLCISSCNQFMCCETFGFCTWQGRWSADIGRLHPARVTSASESFSSPDTHRWVAAFNCMYTCHQNCTVLP